jgi:hypothetical protein
MKLHIELKHSGNSHLDNQNGMTLIDVVRSEESTVLTLQGPDKYKPYPKIIITLDEFSRKTLATLLAMEIA